MMDMSKYKQPATPLPAGKKFRTRKEQREFMKTDVDKKSLMYILFRDDVLAENGLKGHPKAQEAFELAWELGEGDFLRVAAIIIDLAYLLK